MDYYSYLVDIEALDLVIKKHQDKIDEESARIDFLKKQKLSREKIYLENLETCKSQKVEQTKREKELFDIDTKIDNNNAHQQNATTTKQAETLMHELSELSAHKDSLENSILELIDTIDQLEEKIKIDEEYFKGMEDTIHDISLEAKEIINEEQADIKKLETQIEGLLSEVPTDLLNVFTISRDKHRFKSSLATIQGNSCSKCRSQIASAEVETFNKTKAHMICSGCKRLLLHQTFFN